jgi:hypothetical protein
MPVSPVAEETSADALSDILPRTSARGLKLPMPGREKHDDISTIVVIAINAKDTLVLLNIALYLHDFVTES